MFRYGVWVALAATFAMMAQTARAADGFELCNRTNLTVSYAKALNDTSKEDRAKGKGNVIASEGWFNLAPGACDLVWPGKLKSRYYMIYAEAKASNRKWAGKLPICVENHSFKLVGGLCPSGKTHRMFFQIDTGDSASYTYDLK